MVRVAGDTWRPAGIEAWFLVGQLLVAVYAHGTGRSVRVSHYDPERLPKKEAAALAERPTWEALRRYGERGHIMVGTDDEDWASIDVPAIAAALAAEATVTYHYDDGRVVGLAYGAGLPIPATTIRHDLSGPEGPAKSGPKPKAALGELVDLYVQTGRVQVVAEALGISTATVYRRLDEARESGLLPQEKKKR